MLTAVIVNCSVGRIQMQKPQKEIAVQSHATHMSLLKIQNTLRTLTHEMKKETTPPPPKKRAPVLIQFTTTNCLPCKIMKPWLENLRKCYANSINIIEINLEEAHNERYGEILQIDTLPTQIYVNSENKEVFRHEGLDPNQSIQRTLRKLNFTSLSPNQCFFEKYFGLYSLG